MPRVRVLRGTVAAGRCLGVGEVLDLTDAEVAILLPRGKVEIVLGDVLPGGGAPTPRHHDPAPTRRRAGRAS